MVSLIGKIFPEQFSDGSTYIVMKDAIGKMNYISALVESNMIMVPSVCLFLSLSLSFSHPYTKLDSICR